MRLLVNEIKHLFYQLKIKSKQKLAWDKSLFENFFDHEASILTQVLQLAVKSSGSNLDIIPTPGYFMTYDSTTGRGSQKFLSWLALESKELFEMYHDYTYHAVLLALMLRFANIKKSPLKGIVQINDFENLKETASLFKNVAIQTVMSMIDKEFTDGRIETGKTRVLETRNASGDTPTGTIVEVCRKGYQRGDKIIRPVDVITVGVK